MANGVDRCKKVAKVVSLLTNNDSAVAKELELLLSRGEIGALVVP
jgi:hydroxymethylpyrimidine pyrophosphatase-like HAD family hydrolase